MAGTGTKQGGVFRRGPSRTLTRIQTKLIGRKNQLGLSRAARSFGNKANFVGNRLNDFGDVTLVNQRTITGRELHQSAGFIDDIDSFVW